MSNRATVGINDDYAVLSVGLYRFYYGYEITERKPDEDGDGGDWCFQVQVFDMPALTIPRRDLGGDKYSSPAELLLLGIGAWIGQTRGD